MAVLGRLVRTASTWRTVASPKTLIPSPPRSRDLPRRLYHRTLLYLFTSIIIITLFIFLFLFQNSFNYIFNSLNLFGVIVIALNVWFVSIFFFLIFLFLVFFLVDTMKSLCFKMTMIYKSDCATCFIFLKSY